MSRASRSLPTTRQGAEQAISACRTALRRAKGYRGLARSAVARREWLDVVRTIGWKIFNLRCLLRRFDEAGE